MKPIFLATASSLLLSLPATAKPNILFAIADDWGLHAGAYGTKWVKTPNFDRVAKEGVLFKNAYTPLAKCAPSRAVVITGRYPWQLDEAGNHLAYFPTKFKSWPEALMEHDWHVGITGKGWGPGSAKDAAGKPRLITGKQYAKRRAKPTASGINPNDYAANFTDFLNDNPDGKPWCFWYGALEPHRRYEFESGIKKGGKKLSDIDLVPGYWPDNDTVRTDMLDYAYEVEHVDKHLGRMLAELEKRGLLENTIVIVTSDHGMPFPRVKGYAYENANHIPLAIRWPAGIAKADRVISDFVDFTDLAPTILDLAGISEPESGMAQISGKSLRPILESKSSGQVVAGRDHVLIGKERTDLGRPHDQGYPIRGIIRDGFLFLKNYEPDRWPAGNPETGYLDTDGSPTKTLILELGRKDRNDKYWRLNFGKRPGMELYDISKDTDCVKNLAENPEYTKRRNRLNELMTTELKAQEDPRMFGKGEVFDNYTPTSTPGFYERFMKGDKPRTGWVNPSDFEKEPLD
ncbi:MAG: sulfatase [Akkermansiaceae bacterium]|nr:sulfatase [Akkermansiaceae bacterium]